METNKIKYFNLVFEKNSIRKAADLLRMSSESFSKSIKSLEEEPAFSFSIQEGRKIIPTEKAKVIYPKFKSLYYQIEETFSAFQEIDDKDEVYKIGS